MTVALRAHHLLCVLTYVGKGYSAAFVDNYDTIAARLAAGEAVRIVDGPDDICVPLIRENEAHCWSSRVVARDRRATRDLEYLMGRPVTPGESMVLDAELLANLRGAFARNRIRGACHGCQWTALCTRVARDGYTKARI